MINASPGRRGGNMGKVSAWYGGSREAQLDEKGEPILFRKNQVASGKPHILMKAGNNSGRVIAASSSSKMNVDEDGYVAVP
jgi:hypothetical protein